ncbi:MAG: phosphoglycerol geranylgeranyltransferase [Halodesulfurarchaeum sp.]
MSGPWTQWDHVLKLDPDKDLAEGDTFADVCTSGTDAVEIGGTTGMTEEKMERVVSACREYDIPLYQEPSNPGVVIEDPGLDGYLIPTVFNAGDPFWITGAHKEWARIDEIDWDRTYTEAYVVLNPDASVAAYTEANCDLEDEEVAAYGAIAERLFGQDIVYLEYSGMLGDPETVQTAAEALEESTLFYGGGVRDYESAKTMGAVADVVVVGDLVHEAGVAAVEETVRGAKDA